MADCYLLRLGTVGFGGPIALSTAGCDFAWRNMKEKMFCARYLRSAALFFAGLLSTVASGQTLKEVAKIDLPGPAGKRFDYLTIDPDDRYLLSTHLAAGQTYVIDLRGNKVVATIADTPGAEGIEYVSEFKKFYTSNAGDNTIGVVDLRQMKVVKKLPTEKKPDGSTYAVPFHKLYVSDERGKAEAIVDVTKDAVIKTLHFDSETGMPQYDPVSGGTLQRESRYGARSRAPSRFPLVRRQQPDDRLRSRQKPADCVFADGRRT